MHIRAKNPEAYLFSSKLNYTGFHNLSFLWQFEVLLFVLYKSSVELFLSLRTLHRHKCNNFKITDELVANLCCCFYITVLLLDDLFNELNTL